MSEERILRRKSFPFGIRIRDESGDQLRMRRSAGSLAENEEADRFLEPIITLRRPQIQQQQVLHD